MDHPEAALVAKWNKVAKARPGLKLTDLLPHSSVEGRAVTMKILNQMVGGKRCLVGIVTSKCLNDKCDFVHSLTTNRKSVTTLCEVIDSSAKALKLA